MHQLAKVGVETREDFIPFNGQDLFVKQGLTHKEDCPVANRAGEDGLYLPSGTDISEEEQAYVVKRIHEVARAMVA